MFRLRLDRRECPNYCKPRHCLFQNLAILVWASSIIRVEDEFTSFSLAIMAGSSRYLAISFFPESSQPINFYTSYVITLSCLGSISSSSKASEINGSDWILIPNLITEDSK